MSYPYISDLLNPLFGTQWHIPIAMFGSFVALAILISTSVAKLEVQRLESLNILPKAQLAATSVPVHEIVSDLVVVCVFFGLLGARLFHILEHTDEFVQHPAAMLLSRGGFSIYGGLIFGVGVGALYLRKRAIPLIPMLDAFAPALSLAYAIGRIGCQVSGDGDWGIAADMQLKPSWLPTNLWVQQYVNNVIGVDIPYPGVYPTPLYETSMALLIFALLWGFRKRVYMPGYQFAWYLLLSGFARLLIEKIRINTVYHVWGVNFTQAELISTLLILIGLIGILKTIQVGWLGKVLLSISIFTALTACAQL
jgi:phosphatidylglycerol:prolipoprotein diacylglycerol transferase